MQIRHASRKPADEQGGGYCGQDAPVKQVSVGSPVSGCHQVG